MNDTFLKACRGEDVPYTPVWVMRQAGRYMAEYQAIRRKYDFLTMCRTPELAAEVTLQPVDKLGVDAAILFSDILVTLEAMGKTVVFTDGMGPVIEDPIRDRAGAEALVVGDPQADLSYVLDAIKILRAELEDKVPLIGFSGAPFTLATYLIEGGSSKNFLNTKTMMFKEPELFGLIMDKLTDSVAAYLGAQIDAGAQAVQIFDSWAGALSPQDFETHELPRIKRLIEALKPKGVPIIYFANGAAGMLGLVGQCGADVLGIDWRIKMSGAAEQLGQDYVLQGNLDPLAMFLPEEALRQRVSDVLKGASGAKGHVFNLGHGIVPQTPVEAAQALVRAVHELSRRG